MGAPCVAANVSRPLLAVLGGLAVSRPAESCEEGPKAVMPRITAERRRKVVSEIEETYSQRQEEFIN